MSVLRPGVGVGNKTFGHATILVQVMSRGAGYRGAQFGGRGHDRLCPCAYVQRPIAR